MPTILAIETTSILCSVALHWQGTIYSQEVSIIQSGQVILNLIDQLLAQHTISWPQIDLIACGNGPGSFTGTRVGLAVSQGLAFAQNKPVVAISSLKTLAQQAINQKEPYVLAMIDARMQEIYYCLYQKEQGYLIQEQSEQLAAPEKIKLPINQKDITIIGQGFDQYETALTAWQTCARPTKNAYPHAREVAALAQQINKSQWQHPRALKENRIRKSYP